MITYCIKVRTVQINHLNSRFLQLIRNAAAFWFVSIATFLVISSRPTADEFLLAPVIDGFYVDQPKVPLFDVTESRFVGYIKGAHAIVKLGWDAWPNALTFQMGSGALVNYVGPLATVVQGLVFVCLWICSLRLLVRKLASHQSRMVELQSMSIVALGAMAAMSVANFNTMRTPFGLYPFLGIRFGLYVIHALLLAALVLQMLSVEMQEENRQTSVRPLYLWTVAFVGFVSLWYVFYLLVFILLRGANQIIRRRPVLQYVQLLAVTAVSTFAFYEGLGGVRSRTAARTTGGTAVVRGFIDDVVLNRSSRLYSHELWSTVVGLHSLVAWMFGLVAMLSIPFRRSADRKLLRTLAAISLCTILMLPSLFVLQEYVTYEAWWHRSTPIMLSSISFMIIGVWFAEIAFSKLSTRKCELFVGVTTTALVALCASPFADSVSSINRFRANWDAGNILALGSPVENNADYNVINAFRLSPYRNLKWDVQTRMLESIPTSVTTGQIDDLSVGQSQHVSCYTEVELKSSAFDSELGGEVDYKLVLSRAVGHLSGQIGVIDQLGVRWEDAAAKLTVRGKSSVPGRIRLVYFESVCAEVNPIEHFALRFTLDTRKSKSLRIDHYVTKGLG